MNGDSSKTKYLYGVVGDVKQKTINSGDYTYLKERTDSMASDESHIIYKNGKVYIGEDNDNQLIKMLKSCPSKEYFNEI